MNHTEALDKLNNLGRYGIVLTLDRIKALLDLIDHPERKLHCIHIAGTNGKGSTLAMLDSILRSAGFKTGRWTSPHLVEFCERIALDGCAVAPELLADAVGRVWPAVESIKDGPAGHPTQFEVGTAAAFLILAEALPDLVLIEVGLGGRYDSTNVIEPLLTIITHLALDHTERLGPDLQSIAAEKAGTIKPFRPVVIAPQEREAMEVLLDSARRANAPVRLVGRDLEYELVHAGMDGTIGRFKGQRDYGEMRINLLGAHQAANAAAAVAASEVLLDAGYDIPLEAVRLGLSTALWPGRLEIVRRRPLVVLDGAHNTDGMAALARSLREVFRRERVDFLLGILENKRVEEMAGYIAPLAGRVTITTVAGGTAPCADPGRIERALAGTGATVRRVDDRRLALESAIGGLAEDGMLCVCGSLYLVGEIRGMMP